MHGRNNLQRTFWKFVRNPPKTQTFTKNRQPKGISRNVTEQLAKPPLQCWGCREAHYYKNCPQKAQIEKLSNMQEASTIGDITRIILRINATFNDHQAEFHPTMIECKGTIYGQLFFLFDPGASLRYISPKVVERCQL